MAVPRYETNSLNKKPVREHGVTIRRGTGRVNLKQQSAGIPNHQNRSFRDTKRENTFYVSQVKIVLDEVVIYLPPNTHGGWSLGLLVF